MLTELISPKKLSLQFTAWLTAICIEKQHSNHLNHAKTLTQEDVAKIRIQLPDPMKLREQSTSLLRPAVSLLHLTQTALHNEESVLYPVWRSKLNVITGRSRENWQQAGWQLAWRSRSLLSLTVLGENTRRAQKCWCHSSPGTNDRKE